MSRLLDEKMFEEFIDRMILHPWRPGAGRPDGIVPVALIRKIVDENLNGEGVSENHPRREWDNGDGKKIVQELRWADRDGFRGRGKKEYRHLVLMEFGTQAQVKWCYPLWLAFALICDLDDGFGASKKRPLKWWVCESNGGNYILILHELVENSEGQFKFWVNPGD